jgi:hypothetical protein
MLKKLKTIWKNRKLIWQGLWNSINKKSEIEAIAFERMSICLTCPLIDHEGSKCMVPGTAPCCSACGCKLALKTRSLSSQCENPDGPLWKARLTQQEEDELYSKINYNPDAE